MISTGTKFGAYEILAPLGAGGMGEVYRARDPRLGREVALKVLPAEVSRDADRLSRFEQEARAASALNHPNIITVYEIGSTDSGSFIAMELVDGKTLREIAASGPMPVRRVIDVAAQAAEGLSKAHSAGIVHRDLKPENLMVSRDGYLKILDFGLAKLAQPDSGGLSSMPTLARPETQPGTVLGTVAYMSPEQASGQPLDFRSDQFSLGSILYEITTGQKAFAKRTAAETMSAIIREEPEPPGKLRPEVPPPLRWIVERCMAKDPEERYASTRDLARDLAGVRDHISEISGMAEASLAATARPGRRLQPLLVAGILAIGIAAAGMAVRSLWKGAPVAPSFHRLTFRSGNIQNARFAPDGQTIVYGATWAGEPTRLYLTRLDGPESRPFDYPDADLLSISSSGEMAILLGQRTGRTVLARAPLTGGPAREVVEGVPYASADWAPDGKDLAIVRQTGDTLRLEYPIGKVILESAEEGILFPRFSPRGDQIAIYNESPDHSYSLAVLKASGKEKRTLAGGWSDISGVPCWAPNGREIWITVARQGETDALYAIDLAGKLRLIMRVPGSLELEDLSSDGRVLAAHHTVVRALAGLPPGEEKQRDLSWLDGSIPADLSADGKTLVFTETGEGSGKRPSVYLRRTDGSPALRLGEGTAIALSPDGKSVLVLVRSGSGNAESLVLLPTGAGESRTLKDDRLEFFGGGAWLPDGKRIVFAANEKGHQARIYVQDIQGGSPRPITPERAWIRRGTNPVSPDGKLIFGIWQGAEAMLYPVEGGEPRPVKGLEPPEIPIQWSADGSSLLVHTRPGNPNKVWQLDPTSGSRRLLREISPIEPVTGLPQLLISRDGKSYVYGTYRTTSELYVVEGLR